MNRRELIKSMLPLAAIPVALSDELRAEGICHEDGNGTAYKLEKGESYLFVFRAGSVNNPERLLENLRHLNVHGVVQYVLDDPEDSVRIYRMGHRE